MAIDLYGYILVTEYGQNRISIFDGDGIFIHCFKSGDSCNADEFIPHGIACSCSPNGGVYVCDQSNKKIQIFSNC